jgi:hypothetical protein
MKNLADFVHTIRPDKTITLKPDIKRGGIFIKINDREYYISPTSIQWQSEEYLFRKVIREEKCLL